MESKSSSPVMRLSLIAVVCLTAISTGAAEWLRFRGPNGSGVAEGGRLPGEIAADKNVAWKTRVRQASHRRWLRATGSSSPAMKTANC